MSWLAAYNVLEWVIRIGMVPVILRRRLMPATALGWLTLIFFIPPLGLLLYLLIGVGYLGTRRRRQAHGRRLGAARLPERLDRLERHGIRPELGAEAQNMILQAEQIGGNTIVGGNRLTLLADTERFIDRLVEDIDQARHHCHLLYYIYRPDTTGQRVSEALIRAARRGVACRLLADAAGSRPFFYSDAYDDLVEAGVEVRAMLPVAPWRRRLARMDLRNHRKVAVIDGAVGYTGSHNVIVETYGNRWAGKWVDLSGRFEGPVVSQLQLLFLDDWAFETGDTLQGEDLFPPHDTAGPIAAQVVPTGPNHEAETFRRVLIAALNAARESITITTPYLVPDEPTMLALAMAADRGVAITILVPRRSDHPLVNAAGRWYFEQLMRSGVEIHHYCDGMLHAKTITVDHTFALLGSANMDVRSFELNFEVNVLLFGRDVTDQLRAVQQQYLTRCEAIDPEAWQKRPRLQKYADSVAALLSPLL